MIIPRYCRDIFDSKCWGCSRDLLTPQIRFDKLVVNFEVGFMGFIYEV
jgi:hypothetical protein